MQVKKDGRKLIKKLTTLEYECLKEKILKDFNADLDEMIDRNHIIAKISEKYRENIFLVRKSDLNFFQNLPITELIYFGILIGHFLKEDFFYHFEFLDIIAPFTERKIIVDSKGEQTTLYGRNPTKKMLKKSNYIFKKGNKLIILNEFEEVLGLGKSLIDYKMIGRLDNKKVIIKNINDKGWYLRKGK